MRTMVTGVAAFVVLAAAIGAQNQPTVDADTRKLLVRNERALYDAITRGDKAAYQALVSLDGKWRTPTGLIPNGQLADRLGAFELPDWQIENPSVASIDGASFLAVFYTRTGGGRFGGQPFTSHMVASTTWMKRGSQWIAVDHDERPSISDSSLIPVDGPWEITFAEIEAAAGLADLRTASAETVEARVMDRPWSGMGAHPFLRVVRRDGKMRAELFLFWWRNNVAREPARIGTACGARACVWPVELKEQLDWEATFETLAHGDGCGVPVGPGAVCGDCEQAWIKTADKGRYREQSCQVPDPGTPAATLLQFMIRSARAAGD